MTGIAGRGVLAAAVAGAGALLLASPAGAASISVTTTADEDVVDNPACALREAISSANTDANVGGCVGQSGYGDDFILVPGGLYMLTVDAAGDDLNQGGDLDIDSVGNDDLTIMRAEADPVTVDGGGLDRVFHVEATVGGLITIDGLTIRGGVTSGIASGAGILNQANNLLVRNTTLSGNRANGGGGGLANATGDADLQNVTINGNRADADGGGVVATAGGGTVELTNVTVAGNIADFDNGGIAGFGGGLSADPGDISLRNSIVAGNSVPGGSSPECNSGPASLGNNLIQNAAGCAYVAGAADQVNQQAKLGPLAANGGPTSTMALLAGSPAINLGNNPTCPSSDQRGLSRSFGGACDSGAYERALCRGVLVNRFGTGAADQLVGTGGADGMIGLGGADVLKGLAGPDAICAGTGNDKLFGGKGRDKLFGEAGRDRMIGGPRKDRCVGGPGRDIARRC